MASKEWKENLDQRLDHLIGLVENHHNEAGHNDNDADRDEHRTPAGVSSLRPAPFYGRKDEDPKIFLRKLLTYAQLNNWSEEQQMSAFPLFLKDAAFQWYDKIEDPQTLERWRTLQHEFLDYFQNLTPRWVQEQELTDRLQLSTESLESYIDDIRSRCVRLNKSPEDHLGAFIRGLLPEYKAMVLSHSPTTIKEAEERAKLAVSLQALLKPKVSQTETQTLSAKLDKLTEAMTTRLTINAVSTPPTVAAIDNRNNSNGMKTQTQTYSNQQVPVCQLCDRRGHTAKTCRQVPNSVTCYNCGRQGHYARECRSSNLGPQRTQALPGDRPPHYFGNQMSNAQYNSRFNTNHQAQGGQHYRQPTQGLPPYNQYQGFNPAQGNE